MSFHAQWSGWNVVCFFTPWVSPSAISVINSKGSWQQGAVLCAINSIPQDASHPLINIHYFSLHFARWEISMHWSSFGLISGRHLYSSLQSVSRISCPPNFIIHHSPWVWLVIMVDAAWKQVMQTGKHGTVCPGSRSFMNSKSVAEGVMKRITVTDVSFACVWGVFGLAVAVGGYFSHY